MHLKPPIALVGMMGSGKSSVGKALSALFDAPFIDLDEEIEAQEKLPITSIFALHGEGYFREREKICAQQASLGKNAIVALGGGAFMAPETQAAFLHTHTVIYLKANLDTLKKRLENDDTRPLRGNLEELLVRRQADYAKAHLTVEVDSLSIAEIASHIAAIHFPCFAPIAKLPALLEPTQLLQRPVTLIIDATIATFHGDRLRHVLHNAGCLVRVISLTLDESSKNLHTLHKLYNALLEQGHKRNEAVIALGGGVLLDVAAFAAATYMRGVPLVSIPSTLLAMTDAAIGGKNGVDMPQGKNLIGSFYQPDFILIDSSLLNTLPAREIACGMAEIIKHAIIDDTLLWEMLHTNTPLENLLRRSIWVKTRIVTQDPFEKTLLRMKLNLGHTLGHAFEQASAYTLPHGYAVALGILAECRLRMQLFAQDDGRLLDAITICLKRHNLPTHLQLKLPQETLFNTLLHDKKSRAGKLLFALPHGIGDVRVHELDIRAITQKIFEHNTSH